MVFGLFKKTDPICGMKQEKGKGIESDGNWFCSQSCKDKYNQEMKANAKKMHRKGGGCCH